ncbi:hypothetical protein OAL17_00535 [bacterium]|nr:hypothetical protein [bacterium]
MLFSPSILKKLTVEAKIDGSPLTIADQQAHRAILERLATSEMTIVSEESDSLHMEASRYWLVDPLDGTKDFLAGNGEFTVNIALIEEQAPVFGVLYAPAVVRIPCQVWFVANSRYKLP